MWLITFARMFIARVIIADSFRAHQKNLPNNPEGNRCQKTCVADYSR
jgi:hypothetical protein